MTFKLIDKGKEWREEGMVKGDCFFHIKDIKECFKLLKEEMGNNSRGLCNKCLIVFYKEINKLIGFSDSTEPNIVKGIVNGTVKEFEGEE